MASSSAPAAIRQIPVGYTQTRRRNRAEGRSQAEAHPRYQQRPERQGGETSHLEEITFALGVCSATIDIRREFLTQILILNYHEIFAR